MERRVREINRKHVRRKRWHKIATMMAALAAFCTTYALILPAITMSRQLVCGKTEHRHTPSCYTQETVLVCGLEEGGGHTHNEACYTSQSVWTCGLEETEGHSHTESCYEIVVSSVCDLEETGEDTQAETSCTYEQLLICGLEEVQPHIHSEECAGTEQLLVCALPETQAHVHDESCYGLQDVLVCTKEEHTHSEFCYDVGPADANADVETREDWERSLSGVQLSGDRAADVAAVAMSQLGYRESQRNYVLVDDWKLNGYTRYGSWYGDPYGDWDAMFASFVLHYAGVDALGRSNDPAQWAGQIAGERPQAYRLAGEYTPGKGDLIFFDRDQDGGIDAVGILAAVTEDAWKVVEGDAEDAVALISYAIGDSRIAACGLVAGEAESLTQETEPTGTAGYTLTYMANNGTEEMGQQTGSGAVTISWTAFTAPEGMLFSGWNTEPDGSGTAYADGASLELTQDLTLYAQWEAEEAEVIQSSGPIREPARAAATIGLAKQIQWTGTNADDYSYRLHLTLDGSSLSAGSVTTVEPTEKRNIGILLDVTETMLSTSVAGSTTGENKFEAVQKLLKGADGFLASLLDGSTYVSVIVVGGDVGSDYTKLTDEIAAGDKPGDFSNINNSLHMAQGISYVSGLKAAEDYLGQNIDSLVYIVGNETDTHIKYSDGKPDRGVTGSAAEKANYNDYVTFMNKHPELSMYMLYVTPKNRGSDVAEKMAAYSVSRGTGGGYYEADSVNDLKQDLEQIAQQIVVPADKVEGLSITDPLSAAVDLASPAELTATLTLLNSDGTAKSTTVISSYVTVSEDTVTCNYTEKIEGPFKIEIAFDIKTADGVYRPYTDTGDAGTDWVTSTSAGKAGFFSNGEATASFTLNGTASQQPFPKPVVQAPPKATIRVSKEWANTKDGEKRPVTVDLVQGGVTVGTLTLSADNSWTGTCDVRVYEAEENKQKNNIYITEQAVDGFAASYSFQDYVAVEADGEYPVTVTNTKQAVEKTASLTVSKVWTAVPGSREAVIHVCTYDGIGYEDVEGSPFTVTNKEAGEKTFTITWTGEDAPVICVYEEHSDVFYPVLSGDGTAKTVPIGERQLSAMELTPAEDGEYTVTLTNMASVQMPETGGPGTQMYVFGGTALIFGALLLMQIRKHETERRARKSSFP